LSQTAVAEEETYRLAQFLFAGDPGFDAGPSVWVTGFVLCFFLCFFSDYSEDVVGFGGGCNGLWRRIRLGLGLVGLD
jgi:hypothetical protein